MSKFKVGDCVKTLIGHETDDSVTSSIHVGSVGVVDWISRIEATHPITVSFEDGIWECFDETEIVPHQKEMINV